MAKDYRINLRLNKEINDFLETIKIENCTTKSQFIIDLIIRAKKEYLKEKKEGK